LAGASTLRNQDRDQSLALLISIAKHILGEWLFLT
jgi:hypothetical protein